MILILLLFYFQTGTIITSLLEYVGVKLSNHGAPAPHVHHQMTSPTILLDVIIHYSTLRSVPQGGEKKTPLVVMT